MLYMNFRIYQKKVQKQYIPIDVARKNKLLINWDNFNPVKPKKLGIHFLKDLPINIIKEYIDWTPFFNAWGFKKSYPRVLENKQTKNEALEGEFIRKEKGKRKMWGYFQKVRVKKMKLAKKLNIVTRKFKECSIKLVYSRYLTDFIIFVKLYFSFKMLYIQ